MVTTSCGLASKKPYGLLSEKQYYGANNMKQNNFCGRIITKKSERSCCMWSEINSSDHKWTLVSTVCPYAEEQNKGLQWRQEINYKIETIWICKLKFEHWDLNKKDMHCRSAVMKNMSLAQGSIYFTLYYGINFTQVIF
jgi:hypothetical protein